GLDLGNKSCGIAVSDEIGLVHPRENYLFPKCAFKVCLSHVLDFLHKEGIVEVALGLPLNMDGTESDSTLRSYRFKASLEEADPSLKVTLVNETLTTVEADERINLNKSSKKKRDSIIDMEAAVVILESYLHERSGNYND
nr:Holliday junction resolvase RuvX [Bacilli bacterium]